MKLIPPLVVINMFVVAPAVAENHPLVVDLPRLPGLTKEEIASDKMVWVQLQERISLASLAELLGLQDEELSRLNNKSKAHLFLSGAWVKLPDEAVDELEFISAIDAESLRTSPPVLAPLPVRYTARVQSGDSLNSFLSRNGITWDELRSLNPGLRLSSMAAGSELTVAKASSARNLLTIRPTISGGVSWPRRSEFESLEKNSLKTIDNETPITPERQYVINRLQKERELELQRHRAAAEARRKRYRTFGIRTYDWQSWRLTQSGSRITQYYLHGGAHKYYIAVSCTGLRVSTSFNGKQWSKWSLPNVEETQMVIELCSQIKNAPKA